MNTDPGIVFFFTSSFEVKSYTISWCAADANYEDVFNLVPLITLFESLTGDIEKHKIAFLLFRHDGHPKGASFDGKQSFYLNYPLSFAGEVRHLVERRIPITFVYKEQDGRKSATLLTGLLPLTA